MKSIIKSQYAITGLLWIILFGTYLTYPGKVVPFSMIGFYLTLFFCLMFFLPCAIKPHHLLKNTSKVYFAQRYLDKLNLIFILVSFLGVILHLWDKIGIRGYDYFSCIDIRELWISEGAARKTSISSWQSAAGHVLVYFALFPVIFSDLKSKQGKLFFIFSCLIFIIYCWTIVSRSSLLAFAVMTIAAFHQLYVFEYIDSKTFLKKFFTLFSILSFFVVLSFSKKIVCANIQSTSAFVIGSMREHKLSYYFVELPPEGAYHSSLEVLFHNPFKTIKSASELPLSLFQIDKKYSYVLNAIPLYIGNGINNFTEVAGKEINYNYKFIFNPFISAFNKVLQLDILQSDLRSSFSRGMINFPGAVYLSFGIWGILIFPIIFSLFIRFIYIYASRNIFVIPLAAFLQSFLILAPLTNLTSNMSTPFFFFAVVIFLILALVNQYKIHR